MFARVTTTQGSPEQYDQTVRYIQEQLMPMLRQMPGIKGAFVLGDRQTGKGISITLWETEDAMNASAQAANQVRAQGVSGTSSALEGVQGYEVIGHI
ncbi:MAG: antibiotic biosynthesis monooxygenase [Chloroflexota bacterium]|nr:antibiotic biosynthesis monooxygenase [Chloroflexota bacterium]